MVDQFQDRMKQLIESVIASGLEEGQGMLVGNFSAVSGLC
jgi:hypothetical protein